MSKEYTQCGGIGLLGALGLMFVGLKLTGYIDWSWWWVTLPFWGLAAIVLIVFAIAATTVFVRGGCFNQREKNK